MLKSYPDCSSVVKARDSDKMGRFILPNTLLLFHHLQFYNCISCDISLWSEVSFPITGFLIISFLQI